MHFVDWHLGLLLAEDAYEYNVCEYGCVCKLNSLRQYMEMELLDSILKIY